MHKLKDEIEVKETVTVIETGDAVEVIECIEIEIHTKHGKPIPHAKHYVIRIDKVKHTVSVPEMTGRQLLELAGKTPVDRYALYQKFHGGKRERIGLEQVVNFRAPGIECFKTMPLDQTEG
ncbi:MAG: multiubiquitin domain-containing protein [Bdellovibrionota bacterium]